MRIVNSPAHRRYVWRVAIAMAGYLATLFLAQELIGENGATGALAWGAALLPGLCVAGVFVAIARLLVEETDEYQRTLLVRQLLVATGFTMTVVTIYGFLENFDLVPRIPAFYFAMLFFIGEGVGGLYNRLTLGDAGC